MVLWVILVGTVLLLFLRKEKHSKKGNGTEQKVFDHHKVCVGGSENIGSTTQAKNALRPYTVVISSPTLQTLCLSAMDRNLIRLKWDAANFLKKQHRRASLMIFPKSLVKSPLGENQRRVENKL